MQLYTLNPTQDAYVYKYYPNDNYGSETICKVRAYIREILHTEYYYHCRSYLAFDISTLHNIQGGTLRVYRTAVSNYPRTWRIRRSGTFDEDAVTWNNQPGELADSSTVTIQVPNETGWFEIDISSLLTEEDRDKLWIIIRDNSEGTGSYDTDRSCSFNSREGDYKPELIVLASPPPQTGYVDVKQRIEVESWGLRDLTQRTRVEEMLFRDVKNRMKLTSWIVEEVEVSPPYATLDGTYVTISIYWTDEEEFSIGDCHGSICLKHSATGNTFGPYSMDQFRILEEKRYKGWGTISLDGLDPGKYDIEIRVWRS